MYQQPLNRKSTPWVLVGYRAATGLPWKIVRRLHTLLVKFMGGFECRIWGFWAHLIRVSWLLPPFTHCCHLTVRAHPGFWRDMCRLRGATCGLQVGFTDCSNSSHGVSSAYLRAFKLVKVTPAIFPTVKLNGLLSPLIFPTVKLNGLLSPLIFPTVKLNSLLSPLIFPTVKLNGQSNGASENKDGK